MFAVDRHMHVMSVAAVLHPAAPQFVGARRYGGLNSASEDLKGAP
jgi:hypothetical protein